MITKTEVIFLRDILLDLAALADPSEYLKEEVDQAITILDTLNHTNLDITTKDYLSNKQKGIEKNDQ